MPPHRHLGSTCEGGRRTSNCIGLTPEVHGCDKTVAHSEYVENLAVRKNIPFKALDELVHPDAGLASLFLGHCKRFDIRIELIPLSSPVGGICSFPTTLPPSDALGQLTSCVISACTGDVPLGECGVRLRNKGFGVCRTERVEKSGIGPSAEMKRAPR